MTDENSALRQFMSRDLVEVLVRVGLIAIMVVMCFRIFAPFLSLLLWGLILGVALYPLQQRLAGGLDGKQGRASTLLILAAIVLLGTPAVLLASTFAGQIHDLFSAFRGNEVTIKAPAASVADWPIIGEKVYTAWQAAATDLPAFLQSLQPQIGQLSASLLSSAAGAVGDVLFFIGALIIAGIMMAFGQSGSRSTERIISRLTSPQHGPRMHKLIVATIRSVATGVIGVAFIQALLLGVGFVAAGIPAAGLLAIIVMLFGIMQLPAAIISLPAIGYLWWAGGDVTGNIIWSIYLLIAGLADNVLKPLLLGRGVEAPMPVILIGALGGMISAGIVGLFIGAVVLAVGYQLFMVWVDQPEIEMHAGGATPEGEASTPAA